MILITVGTQVPFDRLITTVSDWATAHQSIEIVAQVGKNGIRPKNLKCKDFFDFDELEKFTETAELIISHAGMGTILKSLEKGKPIIIMPRLSNLREHRNDHQLATAHYFKDHPNIRVAFSADDVSRALDENWRGSPSGKISSYASVEFIENIRRLIS